MSSRNVVVCKETLSIEQFGPEKVRHLIAIRYYVPKGLKVTHLLSAKQLCLLNSAVPWSGLFHLNWEGILFLILTHIRDSTQFLRPD